MRWIVASLVVINIATFFYFQLLVDTDPVVEKPVSSANLATVPSVALVTEQEQQPRSSVRDSSAQPALASQPLCTLVGPFEKLLRAEYFSERLQALGLPAEIKNLVVASDPGYWLHLPPEPSRKEALRRLNELQRRGIDSYVIPSGALANGVSLGMFSNKQRAEDMLNKIIEQGYQPQITNVPREQKEIWVFLPQGEAAKLSDERWAELLSADEYLQKRQNFCSDVAPT